MSDDFFERRLASLREKGLYRELAMLHRTEKSAAHTLGRILNFSSNDYLGLAKDRRLKRAAKQAIDEYGLGATASRLLAGHTELHELLEADLACMMGTEAALVFGSGFLTNLGVLSSVLEQSDEVFSDELNHASIIDGIRLSRATCSRYRHNDFNHLECLLKKSKAAGKRVIVSESVFSMDGDIAHVGALAELAADHGALLMIDEAHAIGVLGNGGGGVCRIPLTKYEAHPDIVVGTLSKALGGYGGFVACSKTARDFLINKARTFIYSTGLPPGCLGAARAAISIVTSYPEMGEEVSSKASRFRGLLQQHGFRISTSESHIIPILVGDNDKAVRFSQLLMEKGLIVRAVRPPTVPPGTARARLSITLSQSDSTLEQAAATMAKAAKRVGVL